MSLLYCRRPVLYKLHCQSLYPLQHQLTSYTIVILQASYTSYAPPSTLVFTASSHVIQLLHCRRPVLRKRHRQPILYNVISRYTIVIFQASCTSSAPPSTLSFTTSSHVATIVILQASYTSKAPPSALSFTTSSHVIQLLYCRRPILRKRHRQPYPLQRHLTSLPRGLQGDHLRALSPAQVGGKSAAAEQQHHEPPGALRRHGLLSAVQLAGEELSRS